MRLHYISLLILINMKKEIKKRTLILRVKDLMRENICKQRAAWKNLSIEETLICFFISTVTLVFCKKTFSRLNQSCTNYLHSCTFNEIRVSISFSRIFLPWNKNLKLGHSLVFEKCLAIELVFLFVVFGLTSFASHRAAQARYVARHRN